MIIYEDDCVGCPQGCIDCGRKRVPHLYCDKCDEEFDDETLYDVDGIMLCANCILETFQTIRQTGKTMHDYE